MENGEINGVKASDVQKILNLKHAWELVIDPDVVASTCNYYLLSHIARLVNEGFYENGGSVRSGAVAFSADRKTTHINEGDFKAYPTFRTDLKSLIASICEKYCFSKRFFAHSEYQSVTRTIRIRFRVVRVTLTPSGRRKRFLHLNATAPTLYHFFPSSRVLS